MIILTAATHYSADDVRPFMESLKATGFDGRIICICNGSGAQGYLASLGVEIIADQNNGFDINSRRFFLWKEALRGIDETAVLCDIRDIVFQGSLDLLPQDGLHVFTEDPSMTLGTCPYNNSWLTGIFGSNPYKDKPIICAGFTIGRLTEYCMTMWDMLKDLDPVRGYDQGIHNHIVYSNRLPATIHDNPSPVYTICYVPLETVMIKEGLIYGPNSELPTVVHQYDRHNNLKECIKWQ